MEQALTLAYSTCPNDTYIFHALANRRINRRGLNFAIHLADVEELNQSARTGRYDITKLSFAAAGHLTECYGLLRAGGAIGRGCGPLIVARAGTDISHLEKGCVAVPGLWTTAHLLLSLFLPTPPRIRPMVFDGIMPAVSKGACDAGVMIHEGRFTYHEHGLVKLVDLGEWWEKKTGLPIPLGCIAIRRDLGKPVALQAEALIRESIGFADRHMEDAMSYIRQHARELSDTVIRRHIDLYVNRFSMDMAGEGAAAVEALFAKAREKKILDPSRMPLFAAGG